MAINVSSGIQWAWAAVAVVWAVGLVSTKRTVRVQPMGARVFQLAVLALGFALLDGRWFRSGWLADRFIPEQPNIALTGLAMTILGCGFAIWARIALGGNWSGRATVKAGHELITSGPYAIARHPIYTGLLLAVAGTALAEGAWRSALGFAVIVLGILTKMSQEERLMMQTFPEAYPAYRRRVKALIPGVV